MKMINRYNISLFTGLLLLLPQALSAETDAPLPLSLHRAVSEALANNLSLKLSRENVSGARGQALAAEGEFDTLLGGEGSVAEEQAGALLTGAESNIESSRIEAGLKKKLHYGTELGLNFDSSKVSSEPTLLQIDPAHRSSASVSISQPLLRGRGADVQRANIEAAKRQLSGADYLVESGAADLAAAVKAGYWELVYSHQAIEVNRLSLKLARKLLEETREKITAGRLAPVEIYQPQSEVARREQLLISGERAIGVAEDNLKILINANNWQQPIEPLDRPEVEQRDFDPKQVMDNALNNRPDLLAAEMKIEAAEILSQKKKNNTLPNLALYGRAAIGGSGESTSESYGNFSDDSDSSWQVGLNFSLPLENRFAKGEHLRSMAELRSAKLGAEQIRQEISRKVRSTIRDIELAQKSIEATRKTSLATAKRMEAEQTKFDVGKATTFDVLAAQEAYSQTLTAEYRARVVYVQSLAELDRVQGVIRMKQNGAAPTK
ncbi:MAG: TolC family protein [Thermodesulfobacteriota bacterium]